jgi:hypothetical protein
MKHIPETDLALYSGEPSGGDLPVWRRLLAGMHVARCAGCRERVDAYRVTRDGIHSLGNEMPAGVRWDRLSAEMAANIRVGLAAGECVAPQTPKHAVPRGWRVAAAVCGLSALAVFAAYLNLPPGQTTSLTRAMKTIVHGREWQARHMLGLDEASALVRASADGVELRQNGAALTVTQKGARPVSVSLNTQGSARARYIDTDTGQVTITSVYAQ